MENEIQQTSWRSRLPRLRPKQLSYALAVVVLIAVAAASLTFRSDPFSNFKKLLIDPAYAQDNFVLTPDALDSLGVNNTSAYILKSKQALATVMIKDNLRVAPNVKYNLQELSPTEWRITPAEPLPTNTIFKVGLTAGYLNQAGVYQERDYRWAFQVKDNFRVLNSIPRDTGTGVPVNSGIEVTFSHDNFNNFENYFYIEPRVEGEFEHHGRTAVFVPAKNLAEKTLYKVTVKAGLPVKDSAETLNLDYSFTFETVVPNDRGSNNNPWLSAASNVLEVNPAEKPMIQLWTSNLMDKFIKAHVFSLNGAQDYQRLLQEEDKLPWWSYSKRDYLHDTSRLKRYKTFDASLQEQGYVQFVQLGEPLPRGYYLIELFYMEGARDQVLVQSTELSAYLNVAANKTIVWVNSLKTQSPIKGARLQITDQNRSLETNDQGIAVLDTGSNLMGSNDRSQNKRPYLTITAGDQTLTLPAASLYSQYGDARIDEADLFWNYLYTDRPRYQPTDTIKYWGLVKPRDSKTRADKLKITLYKEGYVDYYYQPVQIDEQTVDLTDLNTFTGEFKVNKLKPDYYTLETSFNDKVIQRRYVNIDPYDKPAYELTLIPDRKVALAGETINIKAQASFFEGTPVPNAELIYETPEGEKTIITGEDGSVALSYTRAYAPCDNAYGCWPSYVWLKIRPKEAELGEISAEATLRFYGPKISLGADVAYPQAGRAAVKIKTEIVDIRQASEEYSNTTGDQAAPNVKIEGEVTKITYQAIETGRSYDFINKKAFTEYRYETKEEVVDNFSAVTDENGNYVYERPVESETSYQVRLKAFDADGRYVVAETYLYYYDGTALRRYQSESDYYSLSLPDGKKYAQGEIVEADFKRGDASLPDNQGNRYLFMQYQNGLQEYRVSSDSLYRFPFEERDIPNVRLVGVYFTGSTYAVSSGGYYDGNMVFNNASQKLKIAVTTDKPRYQPGEKVALAFKVTNQNNSPVAAEINLNLVDEAFYAVADEVTNPVDSVYSSIGSGSIYSTYSHQTVSRFGGAEKGGCFLAGTLILMADGSLKPIEKIVPGDKVATITDPLTHERANGTVTEIYQHLVSEYLIINDKLRVTPEHRVYANASFRQAGELKLGDWLLQPDGAKITITSIKHERNAVPVYNFKVEPYHTYIADGFYVHNEKGGGPREFFVDAPLFKSIRTNASGSGRIEFTLPDNITSWRVTAQGITSDLGVGVNVTKIPVSLPLFAAVNIGKEYLLSDKPAARLRAFGTALTAADAATFTVKAPSLGLETSQPQVGQAYKSIHFPLPQLSIGTHALTFELETAKGKDAIKLPIEVIASRLLKQEVVKSEELTTRTTISTPHNESAVIVLSDAGQNQFYEPLQYLSWSWGDRVDQALARKKARQLLNETYKEDIKAGEFPAHQYQLESGGLALLPYSGADTELSARLAAVAADEFDRDALTQYFFGVLEDKNSAPEQVSLSLYGLASLQQPVLTRINVWLTREDLSPKQKLYLALAAQKLGASELGRKLYLEVMGNYAETDKPYIIVRSGNDEEQILQITAVAAVAASALQAPEIEGLWQYIDDTDSKETLLNLEKLAVITNALPNLSPQPSKVTYAVGGKEREATVTGRQIEAFQLEPQQFNNVSFKKIEGKIWISVRIARAATPQELGENSNVSLRREYYVNGQRTNRLGENDLVEVRLYPSFKKTAPAGDYQITDILPSGLAATINIYRSGGTYDCKYWYPYNTDGQRIMYKISRDWSQNYCGGSYFKYYARTRTRGTYMVEPALIQSFLTPEVANHTSAQSEVLVIE